MASSETNGEMQTALDDTNWAQNDRVCILKPRVGPDLVSGGKSEESLSVKSVFAFFQGSI